MNRSSKENLAWTRALQQECFVHCHTISLPLVPYIIPNFSHTEKFCLFPVLPSCQVKSFSPTQTLSPASSLNLLRLGFVNEIKELMPNCPRCCTQSSQARTSVQKFPFSWLICYSLITTRWISCKPGQMVKIPLCLLTIHSLFPLFNAPASSDFIDSNHNSLFPPLRPGAHLCHEKFPSCLVPSAWSACSPTCRLFFFPPLKMLLKQRLPNPPSPARHLWEAPPGSAGGTLASAGGTGGTRWMETV